jgi:hydroxymethylglutaryl-CoA reductase (NADPH)
VKVPSFLLKRLYVAGSLRNTEDGWTFTIRNSIASGEASGLEPLVVDGRPVPAERCFFHLEAEPVPFTAVSADRPFGLDEGKDIVMSVRDERLPTGPHAVVMAFDVPPFGRLSLNFSDEIG